MTEHKKLLQIIALISIATIVLHCNLSSENLTKGKQTDIDDERSVFLSEIPEFTGNVILARPASYSVTASVMTKNRSKISIEYGIDKILNQRTAPIELNPGEPEHILIDGLNANTAYYYRIIDAETKKQILPTEGNYSFHTARLPGSSFAFTIQADSHLDGSCIPELYRTTLANALSEKIDFHIDMGDTFMTGKVPRREDAMKQYMAQRYYLGLIGHSSPVFLVLGNHDGEEASRKGSCEKDGLAVWSCGERKKNFPNPVPDDFYSGNIEKQTYAGELQDYYSWTWGDALFVVLDPYWYSRGTQGGNAPWNMTLGKKQYDWLAKTLRNSKAKFKFIFIHQLTGGVDSGGRGGIEAAKLYEWGGYDKAGKQVFESYRPGWEKPIHELLRETNVNIVFHGHDHFFARQELDGIIYQLVPQPAHRNFRNHHAAEYGYISGDFFPNSGHLLVAVSPSEVNVSYIRSAIPSMEKNEISNMQTVFKYKCVPLK